jgi:hypothetical protein
VGAGLQWLVGVIRFGKDWMRHGDPYTGHATIQDCGDHCIIGPISGNMTIEDHDAILDKCAVSYQKARVFRRNTWWEYDLTNKPFKRVKL